MDKFCRFGGEIFSGARRATISPGWVVFSLRKMQNGRQRNGIRKTEGVREEQERMEREKEKDRGKS